MKSTEILPFPIANLNDWIAVEQYVWNCTDLWNCYDTILEQIGQVANASRTYIVEIKNNTNYTEHRLTSIPFTAPIVEWSATPHTAQKNIAQKQSLSWQHELPESVLFAWVATLRQDKIVVQSLPELSLLELSDSSVWQSLTVVLLPLKIQGVLYGAIGLEYGTTEQQKAALNLPEQNLLEQNLPELEPLTEQILRNVARVLACKLEQIQYQTQLNALSQQVQQLQNNLENVVQRHTTQLQKALDFEALLKRITDRVRDSLDEQQILQTAVQELATGLGVYSCDAALYDLEQGTSTIAYEYIHCEEISPARGVIFGLADYPEIYPQLLEGQYLQFCWIALPAITPRNLKTPLTSLGCPLIDDQGVIGDIWLYSSVDIYFEIEEVRLIKQVANQCAIALRQARLYQESQAQVQKLEHLNYLKDDFLNTVSHELRSPMANIEMSIQMLELLLFKESYLAATESHNAIRSDSRPEQSNCLVPPSEPSLDRVAYVPAAAAFQQAWRYFRMLQDECLRETNLINDLLDLSRLEAGTEPIFLTTIHLQAWIPHVIEPFLERARNQQQHLQIEIPEDLPPLSTDLSGLERILTELLHNACKYTPAGGKIQIFAWLEPKSEENPENQAGSQPFTSNLVTSTSSLSSLSPNFQLQCSNAASLCSVPKMLLLRISNSGVEIPATELPRIFDKFYRIPSNDPWKHGGTGLGLTLVKRLVEHLGATIDVESSNNQVTFTITLPLSISLSL